MSPLQVSICFMLFGLGELYWAWRIHKMAAELERTARQHLIDAHNEIMAAMEAKDGE